MHVHIYIYIYTYLCLILYDHIHRARDQKIVLGSKIFPRDQKHDVYMILYVNNIICHVKYIYIYNSYLCIEREREEKKERYTHIKKISKYMEKHIYIYIHAEKCTASVQS